jgi:hypothetical protein
VGLPAVVPTPERLRSGEPESFRRPVNNLLQRQKRLQRGFLSKKVRKEL